MFLMLIRRGLKGLYTIKIISRLDLGGIMEVEMTIERNN